MRTLFVCFIVTFTKGSEDSCDKDDIECNNLSSNNIVTLTDKLKHIEQLQEENLNKALEEIKKLHLNHKDDPHLLFLYSKIQRALYSKLHVKMRDVGKLELLIPSIEHLQNILKMPKVTHI